MTEPDVQALPFLCHFHGFRIESTMTAAITKRITIAISMHFLDLFERLFAVSNSLFPDCTWFMAVATCRDDMISKVQEKRNKMNN